jgi:hypothetical protein
MSWQAGSYPNTYSTGHGIYRQDAYGPTVAQGPRGQRYVVRFNIIEDVLGIRWAGDKVYQWADRDAAANTFGNPSPASEADWNRAWQQGPYQAPAPEPEPVTDPFTGPIDTEIPLFTTSDNTKRNLILLAVAVVLLTAVVTINLK